MAKNFINFFTLFLFGFKKYPDPPKQPLLPNTKVFTTEAPADRPQTVSGLWAEYQRQLTHP